MAMLLNKKLFTGSFQQLKRNIFYFLLLDALLFISLYSVNYIISGYIFDFRSMLAAIQQNAVFIIGMIPLAVIYSFAILSVYSVFKYLTLTKLAGKQEEMMDFLSFFWLNMKIFSAFFGIFIIINIAFFSIPDRYILHYAFITLFPFAVFLGLAFNLLHASFADKGKALLKDYIIILRKKPAFIAYKTATYLFMLILYLIYNRLGLAGSAFLLPYSAAMLAVAYIITKFELCFYKEVLHDNK